MTATTYGPTAPLLTAGRLTRLAKVAVPGVRVSTERGADCFLIRVWTGDGELRMLNAVAVTIRTHGYTATVVSLGGTRGRAVTYRVKVTDPRVQEAAEEKIARDRAAALAEAQAEVRAELHDGYQSTESAAALEQAELHRLEAKALEGPLWDGEVRRLRELEERVTARRAAAEEVPAAAQGPLTHEHEEWQLAESAAGGRYCRACGASVPAAEAPQEEPAAPAEGLSYRSIRARAYEVLRGGEVIGRVHRTPHSSDALLWAAYLPGGKEAGHGRTRPEAALTLLGQPAPERGYPPLTSEESEEVLRMGAALIAEGGGGYSFTVQQRYSGARLGRVRAVTEELGGGFWVRYAAYRPDGSRVGYFSRRPDAARVLLP